MDKTTKFSDVAHYYLNTGLKATYTDTFGDTVVGILDAVDIRYDRVHVDGCISYDCIPHLRPLSQLLTDAETLEKLRALGAEIDLEHLGDYGELSLTTERSQTALNIHGIWLIYPILLGSHYNIFNLPETEFIELTNKTEK